MKEVEPPLFLLFYHDCPLPFYDCLLSLYKRNAHPGNAYFKDVKQKDTETLVSLGDIILQRRRERTELQLVALSKFEDP